MNNAAETRSSAVQRYIDEGLHTLITFVFAVLFASLISHVFGRESDAPDQPSPVLQGVKDFSPSELIVVYYHSLGWYNSSFPPLNRLLDIDRTPEYQRCTNGNHSVGQEAFCYSVARGQRDKVDVGWLGWLGPFAFVTALINVVVYEFYVKSGVLLVATYAQLLVGFGLGLMILRFLLYKEVFRLDDTRKFWTACFALVPASIFLGSLAAAILQHFAEEIIIGAWFTAPFRLAEFISERPIEWLSQRITKAIRG